MKNKITKRFQILDHHFGPQSQTLRGFVHWPLQLDIPGENDENQQLEKLFFIFQKGPVDMEKLDSESSRV